MRISVLILITLLGFTAYAAQPGYPAGRTNNDQTLLKKNGGTVYSSQKIGEVKERKGKAELLRIKSVIPAKTGMTIMEKDSIKTYAASTLRALMSDNTVITIGENTIFAFKEYSYMGNAPIKASMRLRQGFFRMITGDIAKKAPNRFRIMTKTAMIGVRGTELYAIVDKDREEIGCMRGSLTIRTAVKNYTVNAGQMIINRHGVWLIRPLPRNYMKSSAAVPAHHAASAGTHTRRSGNTASATISGGGCDNTLPLAPGAKRDLQWEKIINKNRAGWLCRCYRSDRTLEEVFAHYKNAIPSDAEFPQIVEPYPINSKYYTEGAIIAWHKTLSHTYNRAKHLGTSHGVFRDIQIYSNSSNKTTFIITCCKPF